MAARLNSVSDGLESNDSDRSEASAAAARMQSSMPQSLNGACASGQSQLAFRDQSFAQRAFSVLNKLRHQHLLCDVVLCVGDVEIAAHRNVLAASSPYFYAMFTGELAESRQARVSLKGVEASAVEQLVNFAYTSQVDVNENNVQLLLPAASLLQLDEVRGACCEFLLNELHPSNCLGVRRFADLHACRELRAAAERFARQRFAEVSRGEEFLQLPLAEILEILSADDLGVRSEEQVFEAALSWLHHCGEDDESTEGREHHVGRVMSHVRLPVCGKDFLIHRVDSDEMLSTNSDFKDLVIEALKFQLRPPSQRQQLLTESTSNARLRPRKQGGLPKLLLAVGGQAPKAVRSVEKCDLRLQKWITAAELNSRRCRCGVAVSGDCVYALGGFDGSSRVRSVEVYDIARDHWSIVESMNVRRSTLGAAVLRGCIYAVGGFDGSTGLDSVERYDPDLNSWSAVASMSIRRSSVGVVEMGGLLYALGGYDGVSRQCLASVECYDPDQDKWRAVASMTESRSGAAVAVLDDVIYAMGGHDGPDIRRSVECYDGASDTWTTVAPMHTCRRNAGAVTVEGFIYIVGGDDGSSNLSTMEMYDPAANAWYVLSATLQTGRSYAGLAVIDRPTEFS